MRVTKKIKNPVNGDLPNKPEKHIPAKPDENPDPTKKKPGIEPEKNDPTRISEPNKTDPTRIDEPSKQIPPTKQ